MMTSSVRHAEPLPPFDALMWQDDVFEVFQTLSRAARELAKIGQRYTRPHILGFGDLEPGQDHLAWEVSEAAIIASEEVEAVAENLKAATKLTHDELVRRWRSKHTQAAP